MSRWQKELAACSLPPLQGKLAAPGMMTISRTKVFALGDREVTVGNAFQLLYHSLAWGLGTKAPRLHARPAALAADQDRAGDLLVAAWAAARNQAPAAEIYSVLTTVRGAGRIPWFGPAFSTKFLYFSQGSAIEFSQGSAIEPRYVILDAVVAGNLKEAWPGAASGAWFPETYGHFCELMASWAEQATARLNGSRKVRADEIEFA